MDKVVTAAAGVAIKNGEIPMYLNEFFFSCLNAWNLTKMWGNANGNIGWANEPSEYIEAISILESESNKIDQEEMEARMAKIKQGNKG